MDAASPPRAWKVLLAFAIIYFVWGSTFLAIRVGVQEVPPFLLAGMRFLVAGIVLYVWMRARGTPSPSAREWSGASFLALLIFVFDYGLLFWAERRVPSGIAAVMMATIPAFMTLAEIVFLRTQRLTAATRDCAAGGDGGRGRSGRTHDELGRSSGRHRGCLRLDLRGHQLVGGRVPES